MGKKGGFILWIILVVVALIVLGFFTNWFGISGKIIWWGDQDSESAAVNTNLAVSELESRMNQLEKRLDLLEINVGVLNEAGSSYSGLICCRGAVKADDGVSRNQEIDNACRTFSGKQCLQQSACELTTDC